MIQVRKNDWKQRLVRKIGRIIERSSSLDFTTSIWTDFPLTLLAISGCFFFFFSEKVQRSVDGEREGKKDGTASREEGPPGRRLTLLPTTYSIFFKNQSSGTS